MNLSPLARLSTIINVHHSEFGILKWLAFFLEIISGLVLFALMLLTCSDVIGRYLFNNSINGTTELTELALGIVVFCQVPIVTLAGSNVVVDILDRILPSWFARFSALIVNAGVGMGFIFIADRIWFQAARSLRRGVVTEFLLIPVAYFIQFISIMMYVTAAILIYRALMNIFSRNRGHV